MKPEEDITIFQSEMINRMVNIKEEVLKKVVNQFYGWSPSYDCSKDIDKIKKFSFIKHELLPQREFIGHESVGLIGELVTTNEYEDFKWTMRITFVPMTKFPI